MEKENTLKIELTKIEAAAALADITRLLCRVDMETGQTPADAEGVAYVAHLIASALENDLRAERLARDLMKEEQ